MKFFLDANMPYSSKDAFSKHHLDVVHARDADLARAPDRDIFDYAVKNAFVLVTKDLDFANIMLYPEGSHPGMIVLRLPARFTAAQIKGVLSDFLGVIGLNEIERSITILELGRCRIWKPPRTSE